MRLYLLVFFVSAEGLIRKIKNQKVGTDERNRSEAEVKAIGEAEAREL